MSQGHILIQLIVTLIQLVSHKSIWWTMNVEIYIVHPHIVIMRIESEPWCNSKVAICLVAWGSISKVLIMGIAFLLRDKIVQSLINLLKPSMVGSLFTHYPFVVKPKLCASNEVDYAIIFYMRFSTQFKFIISIFIDFWFTECHYNPCQMRKGASY